MPVKRNGLSSPPKMAYVGRLSEEKGVRFLIRALRRIKAEGTQPLPFLTLIGDGPERSSLQQLVRETGCEQIVRFAGQLDRTELSLELCKNDFCVQPSLTEGFSKAWLDAMAHGLPVLATAVGASTGVFAPDGERGWLVPPRDEQALCAKLRFVLQDDWDYFFGEDTNFNGILDSQDDNHNGDAFVWPGQAAAVSVANNGVTDSTGFVILSLKYGQRFGTWAEYQIEARASVGGSEGLAQFDYLLDVATADVKNKEAAPGFQFSPFGVATSCADPN